MHATQHPQIFEIETEIGMAGGGRDGVEDSE